MQPSTASTSPVARARSGLQGTRIVYAAVAAFGLMCALTLAVYGAGEPGVRAAIRATARTTLAVFAVVFCASSLRQRWPGPATHWLVRNRRYLGLAAAVSHAYHLIFILALYRLGAAGETSVVTLVGGSFGFLMFFAMAVTSNDASQRRLGRNWRRLHLAGVWTIWGIYAFSYLPQALSSPVGAGASAWVLLSLALRVWPKPAARRQAGAARM